MTTLEWQYGTAYDLFASLYVLHHPKDFGLRKAWAAGVRARVPEKHRPILEDLATALPIPFPWVATLPSPQQASTAIQALKSIPPHRCLPKVFLPPDTPTETREIFLRIARRQTWDEEDLHRIQQAFAPHPRPPKKAALRRRLDIWAQADAFSKALVPALNAYYTVFFAEEETRLEPWLAQAIQQAQTQAAQQPLETLLVGLTQGVRLPDAEKMTRLILAPSFWFSPLVVFRRLGPDEGLLVFGARPKGASLVPGKEVPDALLLGLRALADPTRLRILRYLAEGAHTPTQLAKQLRLRTPTVVHHLHALRLAGLVYLTLEEGEKRYAARTSQVKALYSQLKAFLHISQD